MTDDANADHDATPAALRLDDQLGPVPRWWHCDTHGRGNHRAWGCPECVRELREEVRKLRAQLKHCGGDNCMGRKMGQATTWVTEQAADARVAAERERCAKLCDEIGRRTTPCGECHLQPGERCDVCGASSGA